MKKHSDFVHLHVHTQYSLLDGACQIPKLLQAAADERMPALAITDHGTMFGAIEFYQQAFKHGVKPIIGAEMYIAPDSRFEKSAHGIQEASFHLVLLAKNFEGYQNLMKLVSAGYLEGFYYRPRIDKDLLKEHAKGLVALSACLKGEIPHLLASEQFEQAGNTASFYKDIFGKDFYLEIQDNLLPEQADVNSRILALSKELDIAIVATNDVHYVRKEHARAHEALLALQTQTTLDDPNRMRMQTQEFYLKNATQMKRTFGAECPQALENTLEIAEKCNLELDFNRTYLPHYKAPEKKSRKEYLRELVSEGLKKRYPQIGPEINNRVEHELEVIEKSGYISYFLIVWDFVHYAKERGIPVGPGRGSAAGSVVSYALGITDIDPLKYDLLFERFLNPERVSMPDIDIDFCYERRSEVIDYVVKKYNKENVAQIITFGSMMAKGVIRDVGRVMGMSYGECDRIAKMVPGDLHITLQQALEAAPELNTLYKTDPRVTDLIDTSMVLEGLSRHASTHAAGVVISEKPLTNFIPLFKMGDGQVITGYPMNSLEKIGLLKMDFLGLRTLTVLSEAVKIIKRTRGVDIELDKLPMEDKKTFELLARADSIGLFQLESSGMRDLVRKFGPEKFEDLIAILALFRPGPMGSGMLDDFIERKHGKIKIRYDHPDLEPILKDTYGIIVFQEQVMRIASSLAGFSLAQADSLRRAMSKKTPEVMAEARKHFIDGCAKNGIGIKAADKIFNQIEYFAGYGFNKCVAGSTELIDADTGKPVTVEKLFIEKDFIRTLSCDEKTYKVVRQKIKGVMCNGTKKVYRLTTRSGRSITVTDNHPFLTVSGWKELRNLRPGDMIAALRTMPAGAATTMEDCKVISPNGHCATAVQKSVSTSDIYWDSVVSIDYAGEEMTYDVEMERIHNFIANDIIVHNSHSAGYAMISYRTAYLKANYTVEFMTALLTSEKDRTDKIAQYMDECARLGIRVLPPDVNESFSQFTVITDTEDKKHGQAIRFGLSAVKNVGQGAIDSIIGVRKKEGKFKSLYHFCEHVDSRLVNRKVIESLIKCGAFDSFGLYRSQLMAILDKAMEVAGGIQKDRMNGQMSFFDTFEDQDHFKQSFQDIPDIKEWPENQLLTFEKEMLGFYITKHPLARFEKILKMYGNTTAMDLGNRRDGDMVWIGGIFNKVKLTTTKKTGERMAIARLEDLTGIVEALVFPKTYTAIGKYIKADTMVLLKARVSLREEEPKLIAEDAVALDEVQEKMTRAIAINLSAKGASKKTLESLKLILTNHRGRIPIHLTFRNAENKSVTMTMGNGFSARPSVELVNEIEELLGEGAVSVKPAQSAAVR